MFDKLTSMGALAIIGTSFSGYLFAENFLTPSPENWNLFVEVSLTMAALMVVKYAWEWFTQRRDEKFYREWIGRTVVVPVWRDEPSPFAAEVLGGRENVHQAVHHLPHDHRALASTTLARRDQRFHQSPFVVGQIARISQLAAVVTGAVLARPHR